MHASTYNDETLYHVNRGICSNYSVSMKVVINMHMTAQNCKILKLEFRNKNFQTAFTDKIMA